MSPTLVSELVSRDGDGQPGTHLLRRRIVQRRRIQSCGIDADDRFGENVVVVKPESLMMKPDGST